MWISHQRGSPFARGNILTISWLHGCIVFAQMAPLSHKMFIGMFIGTLNIRNLYQRAYMIYTSFFVSGNSEPNVDAYTEFWLFLNQIICALLQNNKMPVKDRLILVSRLYL